MVKFFGSYSKRDSKNAIKAFSRFCVGKGHQFWFDNQLIGGQRFETVILDQLHECDCVIVVLSQASIKSDWVRREIEAAIEFEKAIIPIRKGGVELSDMKGTWAEILFNRHQFLEFNKQPGARLYRALEESIDTLFPTKNLAKVVSFVNFKGGVGKTTLSASIGTLFASRRSEKTLLIDLDPQENLSDLFLGPQALNKAAKAGKTALSMFETFRIGKQVQKKHDFDLIPTPEDVEESDILSLPSQIIQVGPISKLIYLIPSDYRMMKFSRASSEVQDVLKYNFNRCLRILRQEFSVVVIDCGPSASLLSNCAFQSSDLIVAPVRADDSSTRGLYSMQRAAKYVYDYDITEKIHPLINFYRPEVGLEERYADNLQDNPGGHISTLISFVEGKVLLSRVPNVAKLLDIHVPIKDILSGKNEDKEFGAASESLQNVTDELWNLFQESA